jgi:predicted dehydrogenase
MQTTSPIVDCGVHYVDVMCQITDAKPVEVRGMGLRLSNEIARTCTITAICRCCSMMARSAGMRRAGDR